MPTTAVFILKAGRGLNETQNRLPVSAAAELFERTD
jgi:hypothetical protein